MSQRDDAIRLAALNTLDTPGRDPDDDLSMMSRQFLRALEKCEWRPVESAPKDGTPLLLFARSKDAHAQIWIVGWFLADIGWVEGCFAPNQPTGIVPTHWMPLPVPPP